MAGPMPPTDADDLDAAFAVLGARRQPSAALMARVMADAAAREPMASPATAPQRPPPVGAPRRGITRGARRAAAGWSAAEWSGRWRALRAPVGLGAALAAGFVLGAVAPAALFDPLAAVEAALFGPPVLLDFADAGALLSDWPGD
ncbi:hypothetical protein CCR87_08455 [Rhodobaculum claviforme]|uniref:Uncharacterized protein n=2 Tax=Rhodobaculum claviforme TaxID=1549854 RepID=A0A934TKY9_9RHOB|nr:hypothetical protein [Rhodobaculum claviforme]